MFCGAVLGEEDNEIKVCTKCSKATPYCVICKNIIVAGDKYLNAQIVTTFFTNLI